MARRISGALAAALLLGLAAAVLAADVERHHDGDDDYAPHHAGKVKVVIEKPEKPPKEPKSAFLQGECSVQHDDGPCMCTRTRTRSSPPAECDCRRHPPLPPLPPAAACCTLAANFVTCPDPYSSFTLVTRLSICSNANGVITGLTYFNDHPKRRTDPVTVCDNSAANTCTDIDLFDPSVDGYKTITTVRVSKAKDAEAKDVAVTCLALGFSDGSTQEFGLCDANIPGAFAWQR